MSSNLGSMVLELSANYAKFQSDMGKVMDSATQAADKITSSFSKVGELIGASISIAAFEKVITGATEAAERVENLSQALGFSTQTIQTLGYAAALVGGNLDSASMSFARMERSAEQAVAGNQQAAEAFHAVGINASQLGELLKNPDQLIQQVATHFAEFGDGAGKTAAVMQIFGRNAQQIIPLLNEIGGNFEALRKHAEDLGIVLSDADQKALAAANQGFDELRQQVTGLGNEFTIALLPAINSVSGALSDLLKSGAIKSAFSELGNEASQFIVIVKQAVAALHIDAQSLGWNDLVGDLQTLADAFFSFGAVVSKEWILLKEGADIAFVGMQQSAAGFFESMASGLDKFSGSGWLAEKLGLPSALSGMQSLTAGMRAATTDTGGYIAALANVDKQLADDKAGVAGWAQGVRDSAKAMGESSSATQAASKSLVDYNADTAAGKKSADELAKALQSAQSFLDKLSESFGGPYEKAAAQYSKTIDDIANHYQNLIEKGASLAEQASFVAQATELANEKFKEQTDAQLNLGKAFDALDQKYANELLLLKSTGDEREIVNAGIQAQAAIDRSLLDVMGPLTEAQQREIEAEVQRAQSITALTQQVKLQEEASKQWQSIWATAGNGVADTFAKVLVEGGSLFNSLRDLAKQTVEAIIAYFAKLAVINPILNSIFGGSVGFSLLPSLANAGASTVGSNILGANGSSSGGGLFDAGSWIGAGKNLFSGFSSLLNGQSGVSGVSSNFLGTAINNSGAYTYTPSLLGSAIGIGGGLLSAYNEYKTGGGVLGAAAYGLGTLTAAGAIAGIASGAGAIAGATGALGTIGLGAIPIVGWVALAAMIVDKISGGKLFGTSANKFQGGSQTETIDAAGADITATGIFKGQRALFGGSYYKDKSLPVDPAAQKAADDFYTALQKGTSDFAKSFGIDLATVVGGSFTSTFDKNGKVTGTSSTVLGVTRSGETQQQFAERLQADSFLKVLDQMGLGASEFVKGLQDDADKLFAGVQDFAQMVTLANTDLGNGFHFLALQTNATLVDVVKFTEAQEKSGESLTQAYARLAQAQQQYNQFVAQFKPGTSYVDDFEAAMSGIYHQMLANINAANKLAIASGAAGASQSDLTNIQNYAAQQMAALVIQLESSAQSLAFSLGLTTTGSLDQVNQAISDIISSAKNTTDATGSVATGLTTTAGALNSFGNTVTAVAKKATDAINLLLGSLSPLNDQEKLQIALQGLAAGTVSKDQVLQIGRALYASSEAYVNLFNQVSQYPDRATGGGGGSRGGRGGGRSAGSGAGAPPPADWTDSAAQWAGTGLTLAQWNSMSDENKKKLEDLLNKQSTLQAAKTSQDFNTLGQQIAEIATAKGEDFQTVIDDMGINNKDLEKGLGLKSDAELMAYLKKVQDQEDSAKENTQSIVDAINALPDKLAIALNGRGAAPSVTPGRPSPAPVPSTPGSGSGSTAPGAGTPLPPNNRGGVLTQADYDGIGGATVRAWAPHYAAAIANQPRNFRQPA